MMEKDEFYNDENMKILQNSIQELESGLGQEHELVSDVQYSNEFTIDQDEN